MVCWQLSSAICAADSCDCETPSTLMKSASLLFLSFCLNLALAGAIAHWHGTPRVIVPALRTNSVLVMISGKTTADAGTSAPMACVTNRFHWRMIERTNYEEYVANLRAVGCPEKTVRDIILADVENLYAERRRAVGVKGPFWLAGKQKREADRAREEELAALKQEQEALIRRLLGIEWFADGNRMFDSFEDQAIARFLFGPMPEETFQRVEHVFEKYEALKREIDRRCGGIRLEEDSAQLRDLYQRTWQELASALTPLQLEEMMARGSLDHVEFAGVEVTVAEARQIALAKAAVGGRMFDWPGGESEEEQSANEEQFQAAIKNLLGENRYADFERAQDGEFRTLYDLGKENNFSKDIAVQIYEMRKLAQDEVQRLRQDVTLDEAARRQHLEEMQTAIQKEILSALGSGVCQEYLQRGGAWVTNLNKL